MTSSLIRLSSALVCLMGYLSPQMALASDEAPASTEVSPPKQDAFTSQGQPLAIDSLGIVVTPPSGWEVSTNTGSISVVMREPRKVQPDYEHPKYQKNITIAAIHNASPIDEKRATELTAQLTAAFTADKSLSDFTVTEHKFFNFHGVNDGLLVYSTMTLGDYQMQQMHVLVSGQSKQFLMTYTDLASNFGTEKDPAYAAAWETMVSIQVAGETPTRQAEYLRYATYGGAALLLLLLIGIWRYRAHRVDYKSDADAMIDAEEGEPYISAAAQSTTAMSSSWSLNSRAPQRPATKKTAKKASKRPASSASELLSGAPSHGHESSADSFVSSF